MNEEKLAMLREVVAFIKSAAPVGAIEWAKSTEPHRTNIEAARASIKDTNEPRPALRQYASAFFRAFRAFLDETHPSPLTPADVRGMSIQELWHSSGRVTAIGFSSPGGSFNLVPRTSADPVLAPAISAAELELLRVIPLSRRLMVDAGLLDAGDDAPLMQAVLAAKRVFPGALVEEVTDYLGDRAMLLPHCLATQEASP